MDGGRGGGERDGVNGRHHPRDSPLLCTHSLKSVVPMMSLESLARKGWGVIDDSLTHSLTHSFHLIIIIIIIIIDIGGGGNGDDNHNDSVKANIPGDSALEQSGPSVLHLLLLLPRCIT